MSSVFNEMSIGWKGGTYTLTPSNRLLRKIEAELSPSSLTDVISRMNEGKPPIAETAFIISKFLEAASAPSDVSDEDEIYGGIMEDFENNEGAGFVGLCEAILTAISPAGETAKKSSAVSGSVQGGGKKTAKKGKKTKAA